MTERTWRAYQDWAPTYDTDPNPQTALEFEAVLELLAAGPGDTVGDAACGTGRYAARIADRGARVVGFDFSPGMLAAFRQRVPALPVALADLDQPLPFRDGVFSHVLCAQTLKHLPSLGHPLRELHRLLRPGGRLVFSVTHPEMDFAGYDMRETPAFILSQRADTFHHQSEDYREALWGAGFEVEVWRAVRVSDGIAHLLTPTSLETVRGRPQVLAVRAVRSEQGVGSGESGMAIC